MPGKEAPEPRLAVTLPEVWSSPADTAEPTAWLADYDAPGLADLVNEALTANPELRAASARVAAARARAEIAGAPLLPSVQAELDASRSRQVSTLGGVRNTRLASSYGLDASISWEADVWGRLGDAAQAAVLDREAAAADLGAARLSLAADVVRGWLGAVEADQQGRLAGRTVSSFNDSLAVIEERYRRGLGTALDLRLARENVATARANLAQRLRERDTRVRALETLLGRYPAGTAIGAAPTLPALRAAIPAGLPSQLLARRPDLAAADRRLLAAEKRLDEARKNRLPGFSLTASGGASSNALRDLLDWNNLVWSLLGRLTQPVFQGGRLAAEEALARADNAEALADYARVALNALREVETALAAEDRYREQESALATAAMEAREAASLALDRYARGLADIATLLEAQRRAFNAESNLLSTTRQRLANRIDLYLALGGDFASPAPSAPDGT